MCCCPTVISVAGVCRSWRSVARAHRFCYAYISLDGDDCETDDQFGCKGVFFAQSIVRAEKLFDRLSIRVVAPTFLDEDGGTAPPDPDNPDTDFLANVLVINTIALHLANVCKLHLTLPENCWEVFSCLCDHTAPMLEELFIAIDPDDDNHMGPFDGLPDNLFATTAPLLHTITLDGLELSASEPIGAFSRARKVTLAKFRSDFLHAIAPNFPAVVHLDVDLADADCAELYPPFRACVPLSSLGSHLRHLHMPVLEGSPVLRVYFHRLLERRAIEYVCISFVRQQPRGGRQPLQLDAAPFLLHVGKPFRVCVREGTYTIGAAALRLTDVEVHSLGSAFARVFRAEHDAGLLAALLDDQLAPHVRELVLPLRLVPEVSRRLGAPPRLRALLADVEDASDVPADCLAALARWSKQCPARPTVDLRFGAAESRTAVYDTYDVFFAALYEDVRDEASLREKQAESPDRSTADNTGDVSAP
ncbi:hypothetical protein AURDEDRAFT_128632 [Auricularia subglabra TFB-10046 SS5]|nr:hypothetical protein AURDEDRAFT_128632 [Auricularia subglabra TFB-10046 SS5]